MSVNAGPDIVNSGLILNLDAANTKSYPGSGTTWTDTSGNAYNGTLTNGPTFSSSNNGYFTFDGVNDYSTVSSDASILSSTAYTKCVWFYITSFVTSNNLISGTNGAQHAFWLSGGTNLQAGHNNVWNRVVSTTTLVVNTWYFGAVSFSNTAGWKLWLNGNLESTNADTTTFTGTGIIRLAIYDSANFLTGRIAQVLVYNRALTDLEVLQNFISTRGRFGI